MTIARATLLALSACLGLAGGAHAEPEPSRVRLEVNPLVAVPIGNWQYADQLEEKPQVSFGLGAEAGYALTRRWSAHVMAQHILVRSLRGDERVRLDNLGAGVRYEAALSSRRMAFGELSAVYSLAALESQTWGTGFGGVARAGMLYWVNPALALGPVLSGAVSPIDHEHGFSSTWAFVELDATVSMRL